MSKSSDHCIDLSRCCFFVSILVLLNTEEHSSKDNGNQSIDFEAQLHCAQIDRMVAYTPQPVQFLKRTNTRTSQPTHVVLLQAEDSTNVDRRHPPRTDGLQD